MIKNGRERRLSLDIMHCSCFTELLASMEKWGPCGVRVLADGGTVALHKSPMAGYRHAEECVLGNHAYPMVCLWD